jgi:hypothetical protein
MEAKLRSETSGAVAVSGKLAAITVRHHCCVCCLSARWWFVRLIFVVVVNAKGV